jgi:hypothetical protein
MVVMPKRTSTMAETFTATIAAALVVAVTIVSIAIPLGPQQSMVQSARPLHNDGVEPVATDVIAAPGARVAPDAAGTIGAANVTPASVRIAALQR